MEPPYPFITNDPAQTHVYFPHTHHHGILERDAQQTIVAYFLPQAQGHDPDLIQSRLAALYGGEKEEYLEFRYSQAMYMFQLPDRLDREVVLRELQQWMQAHYIYAFGLHPEDVWHNSPPPFRVYLKIHDYPITFWHQFYFRLLVSGFGHPLYVDPANLRGRDRTNLRLTIQCHDPTGIPEKAVIHLENKWKTCQITVLGWELDGALPPEGYDGPTSDGNLGEVNWEEESSIFHRGNDNGCRTSMAEARMALFR